MMKIKKLSFIVLAVFLLLTGLYDVGQSSTTTTVRTLVYHQISNFDTAPNSRGQQEPMISDDGSRIVYTVAPGTQDPARPNRIFVIKADGTDTREVDAYQTYCFCGSILDISADGRRVISSDYVQLRIADIDDSSGQELIAFNSNEIKTIRLAGDGSKVFFIMRRDATIRGTSNRLERGLYAINPDGSGLDQIVGPAQIATLLNLDPNAVFPFDADGVSLDVSHDGQRLVFGVQAGGRRIFVVRANGSGLRQLFGPERTITSMGISGNGEMVVYNFVGVNGAEGHAIAFNATEPLVIASNQEFLYTDGNTYNDRITLSKDGTTAMFGSFGHLFHTDGEEVLWLSTRTRNIRSNFYPGGVTSPTFFRGVMSGNAKRFLFLMAGENNVLQLATLDIDPVTFGDAPEVDNPSLTPAFVLNDNLSLATIQGRVQTANPLLSDAIDAMFLDNGLEDGSVWFNGPMVDDGQTSGDETAGDNVYTNNSVHAAIEALIGPRNSRVRAENRSPDGKLHGTAVEFVPFFVVSNAPPSAAPVISRIEPASGQSGTQVTIFGENFDPVIDHNVVLFGNRIARVVSGSTTELVVQVPTDLTAGSVVVTVSALGKTSNPATFTVTGTAMGWEVRLFNIDDRATLQNNGSTIVQATLAQDTGRIDLMPYLQSGLNTLSFTLDNVTGTYAYGFEVYYNGQLHLQDSCGLVGDFGCNDDGQATGVVYERTFLIRQ